jgi:hypothetical protein
LLPPPVDHLFDLFRLCRANLLILADAGEIHPGPTIYDSAWVRDSSVEGTACALVGDSGLAESQFGDRYPALFNLGFERIGPVSAHGFFGGEHEKNDHEWDSNGQALWAIGRFDRIQGAAAAFGARMFSPYVVEGARWIRTTETPSGCCTAAGAPSAWARSTSRITGTTCGDSPSSTRRRGSPSGSARPRSASCGTPSTT